MDDALRRKYLQTGAAVLKGGGAVASGTRTASSARDAERGKEESPVSAPRSSDYGDSSRRGKSTESAYRWLWRLVKLALVLLALFVALIVYFAVKGPVQADRTDSAASATAVAQDVSPVSADSATTASEPESQAAAEPAPAGKPEVASAPSSIAAQVVPDAGVPETHTSLAPTVTTTSPAPPPPPPSATAWLSDFLIQHASDTDCGELKDIYCKADLVRQAARLAYDDSVKCDRRQSSAEQCNGNGRVFIERRYRDLEIQTLTRQKTSLQNLLLSASKTGLSDGNVMLLAEPCERQAVNDGLRDAAYFDYAKHTCMPRALEIYLRPKKEMLKRVNVRLNELNATSN